MGKLYPKQQKSSMSPWSPMRMQRQRRSARLRKTGRGYVPRVCSAPVRRTDGRGTREPQPARTRQRRHPGRGPRPDELCRSVRSGRRRTRGTGAVSRAQRHRRLQSRRLRDANDVGARAAPGQPPRARRPGHTRRRHAPCPRTRREASPEVIARKAAEKVARAAEKAAKAAEKVERTAPPSTK